MQLSLKPLTAFAFSCGHSFRALHLALTSGSVYFGAAFILFPFCAFGSSLLLFCEFRFWQLHKMKQMRNKFRSSSFSLSVILLDGRSLCASLFLLFCCKCSVEKCLQRVLNAIIYWCCFSVAVLICRAQKELQKINKIL